MPILISHHAALDLHTKYLTDTISLDPAFSSTLAREKAFDAAVWRRRALDPLARTFAALLNHDHDDMNDDNDNDNDNGKNEKQPQNQNAGRRRRVIISSLILRGPYPSSPTRTTATPTPTHEQQGTQPSSLLQNSGYDSGSRTRRIEWEINGVYTDHRFRRRGVASAVFEAATRFALRESAAFGGGGGGGVDCVLRLGVTRGNAAARRFYEKAGFVAVSEEGCGDGDGEVDLVRVFAL